MSQGPRIKLSGFDLLSELSNPLGHYSAHYSAVFCSPPSLTHSSYIIQDNNTEKFSGLPEQRLTSTMRRRKKRPQPKIMVADEVIILLRNFCLSKSVS